MAWLAGQVFLLCLVSFLAGAALTTLALRRKPPAEPTLNATPEAPVAEEEPADDPDVREATEPVIIKASRKSMRYHTPDSPYYNRVKGDLTFPSTAEAELAGYTAWNKSAVRS